MFSKALPLSYVEAPYTFQILFNILFLFLCGKFGREGKREAVLLIYPLFPEAGDKQWIQDTRLQFLIITLGGCVFCFLFVEFCFMCGFCFPLKAF